MSCKPLLYVIHDDDAIVVCSDYHVIKALARALVFVTDHPVTIHCGPEVIKTMGVGDADAVVIVPLSKLRGPIGSNDRVDP